MAVVGFQQDRASRAYLLQRVAGVSAAWLTDVARRHPPAEAPPAIPTRPGQFTCSWLTAALRGDNAGAEVTDFTVSSIDRGTSTRFPLTLEWNAAGQQADLPTKLFVKVTDSWQQRLVLGLTGMVKGEAIFYPRIRPLVDIEAPEGYYGAHDEKSWRSIAIMENIVETKGARFLSPLEPSDRAGIEDLLTDLAAMHGRFWCHPQLTESALRDSFNLISWSDSLVNLRPRSHVGVDRAAAVVPREIADRTDDIYDANFRTLQLDRLMPSTFLHGDGHAGQRYQTASGRSGLSDWQVVHRGHWAWDVAYLINSALTVENRRAWDRELIAFYLERLAAAGGDAPSFDVGWREYRRHAFYPYIAWIFTIGRAAYHPHWQPDEYSRAIIERTGQAIVDHDAFDALASSLAS